MCKPVLHHEEKYHDYRVGRNYDVRIRSIFHHRIQCYRQRTCNHLVISSDALSLLHVSKWLRFVGELISLVRRQQSILPIQEEHPESMDVVDNLCFFESSSN